MMPTYYDGRNQPHVLNKRLGAGGEGAVYACDGDPRLVAKIYHEPVTAEKSGKLRWMASNQDESLGKVAAWVTDVLLDAPGGKVVGFLMPGVRAKEIHELYSLKSRRVHFPEATWHFLIHAAANLARAFYSLHKNGHVMGDVNHGNCVVLADGTVKLIDCDSYSIRTQRRRHPCEVGVLTHLAPELQGINLRDVERQTNHDNFGLAVIIFQLLFLGRHPFAGNFLAGEDKPIEVCIRENLFAYGRDAARKTVAQPPGTLPLSAVSPAVAELFERAFTKIENRPTPREWVEALEDLADSLEQCRLNPGHLFYEKCAVCPWCEIEAQTGLMLFPFVTTNSHLKAKHKKPFDVVTVENLVESFDIKPNLPARLSENLAPARVAPAPEIVRQGRSERNQKIFLCSIYFLALFFVYSVTGANGCLGCVFVFSIAITCYLYNVYKDSGKTVRGEERNRLYELEYKWGQLENEWGRVAASPVLERELALIKERLDAYAALRSAAIEKSPRASENATPAGGEHAASEAEGRKWRQLEQEIGDLLGSLRAQSVRLRTQRRGLLARSQKIARDLQQAQSNVRFLGSSVPIGLVLVLITVGAPVLSYSLAGLTDDPGARRSPVSTGSTSYQKAPMPGITYADSVTIPDEDISDREISKLSPGERDNIINEIVLQARKFSSGGAYELAEGRLKFALRFDDKNTAVLNALGELYYDQRKYNQALAYLSISQKISDAEDTSFLIGMTYLNMKKYAPARDVFVRLTRGDDFSSGASFYNLGLACQGLGDHRAAVEAFERALSIKEYDVDAIYQVAISLNKLGRKGEARHYYGLLEEMDPRLAERLKRNIGKSLDLDSIPPPSPPSVVGVSGIGSP